MSSIRRAIQILDLLARRAPLGVREIAVALQLPLGSTHRILTDLQAEDMVQRTHAGAWELSYRLLQIAGRHLDHLELPRLARPHLEQLAAVTQETVFLAVPRQYEIVHLDKVEPHNAETEMQLRLTIELGARRPMYCTGLGKAILAFLPRRDQDQCLPPGPFPRYTPNTITDAEELRSELQRIHERGYATDHEETILGMQCIAVPILNHLERPVAAISIVGARLVTDPAKFTRLVPAMQETGAVLSHALGAHTRQVQRSAGDAVPQMC